MLSGYSVFPTLAHFPSRTPAEPCKTPSNNTESSSTKPLSGKYTVSLKAIPTFSKNGVIKLGTGPKSRRSAWRSCRMLPATVTKRLDENFFRVRFDRLTPREKRFLRVMAELGPGAQRGSEVAECLSVKINSIGPTRAKLINKGMIYSPAHGYLAFTVPLFDDFMRRTMPEFAGRG